MPASTGGKTRLAVRIGLFWGGYLAILWLASFAKGLLPGQWGSLCWGLASSLAIFAMTVLFLQRENRRLDDIGLRLNRMSLLRLVAGIAAGFAVFGLQILSAAIIAGPVHFIWEGRGTPAIVGMAVISTLALAAMEELGFRGYTLRTMASALGVWPAVVITAVAFGLCHLAFGWSWVLILSGVVPCGLLFGMSAIASRGLAVPVGLHAGLNLAQASLDERSGWAFCRLVMDEAVRSRLVAVAPFTGIAAVLSATFGCWWWHRGRARRGGG